MEQANQNTQNLNLFTSHDLLKVMGLNEFDEISFNDRKFRVRDLSCSNSTSEVKLYLLDDENNETNKCLNLSSLVGIPYKKVVN